MKQELQLMTDIPAYRFLLAGHIQVPGLKQSIRQVNRRQRWRRLKASFLRTLGR
jgi:hypothetical protein